tara:strand:- start:2453 stop:2686 length:234 start_codon:yes stop_codon:yes gene_type:complete
MTAYRIQARVGGKYLEAKLDAPSDREALDKFVELASEDKLKVEDTSFYMSNYTCITLEEIDESRKNRDVKTASTSGA